MGCLSAGQDHSSIQQAVMAFKSPVQSALDFIILLGAKISPVILTLYTEISFAKCDPSASLFQMTSASVLILHNTEVTPATLTLCIT